MNAYEVLGNWGTKDGKPLPKNADKDMIKKAYRRASKKAHPDRNGGDVKAMVAINQANDILSDPRRRERHDLGQDDAPITPPLELKARQVLAMAFANALQLQGSVNYVSAARNILRQIADGSQKAIADMDRTILRLKKSLPLVELNKESESQVNVWEDQINYSIGNLTGQREEAVLTAKAADRAREILIEYKCSVPENSQFTRSPGLEFLTRGF